MTSGQQDKNVPTIMTRVPTERQAIDEEGRGDEEMTDTDVLDPVWQSLQQEIVDQIGSKVSEQRVKRFLDSMKKKTTIYAEKACTLFEREMKECISNHMSFCQERLDTIDKDEQLTGQLVNQICLITSTSRAIGEQTKMAKQNRANQQRIKLCTVKINGLKEFLFNYGAQLCILDQEAKQMSQEYHKLIIKT